MDFNHPDNNRFMVVNQVAIQGIKQVRRPDIIGYINGLPVAVIELKSPIDANADIWAAFNQLQTYKNELSDLFICNEALVVSDGQNARIGSLTADEERFLPWKTSPSGSSAISARVIANCIPANAAPALYVKTSTGTWSSPPTAARRAFASTRSKRSRSIIFIPAQASFLSARQAATWRASFCQNWDISRSKDMDRLMDTAEPQDIADAALAYGAQSVEIGRAHV